MKKTRAFRVFSHLSSLISHLLRETRGFTLIELMVTVAIVTVLIGAGVPAFRRFGRVQQLDIGASQIKAAILDTRALALSPRAEKDVQTDPPRVVDCPAAPTTPIDQYSIVFQPETNGINATYKICEGPYSISTSDLPALVNVTTGNSVPIIFSISKRGTIISPSNPAITVQHQQLTDATRTVSVIGETGAVSIQ